MNSGSHYESEKDFTRTKNKQTKKKCLQRVRMRTFHSQGNKMKKE